MNEQEQIRTQLQRMTAEIKRDMKPKSKNELIRIISALALDNFVLKTQLAELQAPAAPAGVSND